VAVVGLVSGNALLSSYGRQFPYCRDTETMPHNFTVTIIRHPDFAARSGATILCSFLPTTESRLGSQW
jgi:hypothetical protein